MKRLVLFWITSVVIAVMVTFAWAQSPGSLSQPRMLSGADLAFRVEAIDPGGKATGTWMVRYNGNWVEVGSNLRVHPAK